jgi:dihydroorotate dehydrogenase (NAD+) catalytic subunit
MTKTKVDMTVKIGGLTLSNPVLLASGTCGYGEELSGLLDLNRLGGIITKTITVGPRRGNPPPRVAETPSGLLNSIGLENVGLEKFLEDKAPVLAGLPAAVLVSVGGESVEEYVKIVGAMEGLDCVRGLELNVSCPNVDRGMAFGSDPSLAREVVGACRERSALPLVAKLTPNTGDIAGVAAACEEAGADAVTVANTFLGLKIDLESGRPALRRGCGGLSGPAIRPLSVAKVWEVSRRVGIPIIGSGGICGPEDALEHILAGASAVQVGTASFVNPDAAESVLDGLEEYCVARGVSSISELVGSLRVED